jgi:hypothetical protein
VNCNQQLCIELWSVINFHLEYRTQLIRYNTIEIPLFLLYRRVRGLQGVPNVVLKKEFSHSRIESIYARKTYVVFANTPTYLSQSVKVRPLNFITTSIRNFANKRETNYYGHFQAFVLLNPLQIPGQVLVL